VRFTVKAPGKPATQTIQLVEPAVSDPAAELQPQQKN